MYTPQIEVFINVADCGSFNKAAEKLYISSTAVMKQINALEKHLGLKLLRRTPRGITLTDVGKSIYKDAKFVIKYSNEAIMRAHQIMQDKQYIVRVGTSLLNPCKVLMDLWGQITDEFPQFKIQVVPYDDNRNNVLSVLESLGTNFDFIVAPCASTQWLKRIAFYQLGAYKICCAVSRKHKLATKHTLNIENLFGERLMMVQRGDVLILDELRDYISENYPQIKIEDTSTFYDIEVFNRCEQSNNVLLTLECWKDVHPSLVTIPVDWGYTMPYGLLYPLNPSKDVLEFLEATKTVL